MKDSQTKQVEQPAKNEPTLELLETVKIALFYRDFGVLNEYLAGIGEKKIEAAPKGDDVKSPEEIYYDLKDKNERTGAGQDIIAITAIELYHRQFAAPQAAKWVQGEWQLCPKCLGEGFVSTHGISTATTEQCNVCNGAKIIQKPILEGSTDKNQTK